MHLLVTSVLALLPPECLIQLQELSISFKGLSFQSKLLSTKSNHHPIQFNLVSIEWDGLLIQYKHSSIKSKRLLIQSVILSIELNSYSFYLKGLMLIKCELSANQKVPFLRWSFV